MKNELMGLIFAENPEASMGELTGIRSLAAVPFGGKYRMIDFILSNMVNSSIINVGLTTPYNHQSLSDHLGTGKDWNIDRKGNGLFLLPPKEPGEASEIRGGIDIIHDVSHYLNKCRQEYVIVANCNTLCNIDFSEVFKEHLEKDADITMIYTETDMLSPKELKTRILLDIDENSRISDIEVYPITQRTNAMYMHMFMIRRSLLLELVGDAVAHNRHIISKDILLPSLSRLRVFGYRHEGYTRQIDNIKSFFCANLELLDRSVRDELFGLRGDMPIYTKIKDSVPTKYTRTAEVSNSFIADGCIIEGTVKNSVLFRGVHIGKGAIVENCILMQKAEVMENCLLENVIFDKEVVLRSGKKLVGQDTYPMVIGKKTII